MLLPEDPVVPTFGPSAAYEISSVPLSNSQVFKVIEPDIAAPFVDEKESSCVSLRVFMPHRELRVVRVVLFTIRPSRFARQQAHQREVDGQLCFHLLRKFIRKRIECW